MSNNKKERGNKVSVPKKLPKKPVDVEKGFVPPSSPKKPPTKPGNKKK